MTAERPEKPQQPVIRDPDVEPARRDPEPAPPPARDPDPPQPPRREPPPVPPEPGEPVPTIEDPVAPGEAPAPMQVLRVSF
jgi:hypothetical protein